VPASGRLLSHVPLQTGRWSEITKVEHPMAQVDAAGRDWPLTGESTLASMSDRKMGQRSLFLEPRRVHDHTQYHTPGWRGYGYLVEMTRARQYNSFCGVAPSANAIGVVYRFLWRCEIVEFSIDEHGMAAVWRQLNGSGIRVYVLTFSAGNSGYLGY
jgi:hypothetical protein